MRKADNLPPSCTVVTKSGNLNFLEPSGPLQAFNGTAVTLQTYFELIKSTISLHNIHIRCSLGSAAQLVKPLHHKTGGSGFGLLIGFLEIFK